MSRRRLLLATLAAVAAAGPAASADAAPWHAWSGTSGDDAGHAVVSRGEAIWTNYLYDDYGANVDGFTSMDPDLLIGALSPHVYPEDPGRPLGFAPSGNVGRFRHSGDYAYPPDKPYPQDLVGDPLGDNTTYQNVANVAETRVAATATDVFLRFTLTDLGGDPAMGPVRGDTSVIGLAINPTPGSTSGGGAWPFAAQVSSPGWTRLLTVWGTGGALTTAGGGTQDLAAVGGEIREDLAENTIEVRLPRAAIGTSSRWQLVAGAGRWDPKAKTWAAPQATTNQTTSPGGLGVFPRLYELPFHHDEPNSLWNETGQANALRDGTIAGADWTVDLAQLASGATVAAPCRPGPREESFDAYSPGSATAEGVAALPTQNGGVANLHNVNEIYRWRRQPLALMLPESVCERGAPKPSLDYVFHPANVNHNAWLFGVEAAHDRVNYLKDPLLDFSYVTALANRMNRITASGLARTDGWNYGDAPGEEAADDDALKAVAKRYAFDPDRVRLLGMSGRLGAPFFAETWPDRASSMFTVSPHTADTPKLANLRNTPWVFAHGTSFLELQSDLPSYVTLDDHLSALGNEYLHMTWNGRGHDFNLLHDGYDLAEPWTSAPRIHPARITYVIDPKDKRPGVPLYPGVDWVPAAAPADGQQPARLDVTDLARADALPERDTRFTCRFVQPGSTDALDYHGLSHATPAELAKRMPPAVAKGWSVLTPCTYAVTPLARPARANGLSGSVANLRSLTVDLDAMGIDPRRPVSLDGLTGTTTLHLRSRHGDATVRLPLGRCVGRGRLRYALRRGAVAVSVFVDGHRRVQHTGRALRSVSLPRPTDDAFTVKVRTRLGDGSTVTSTRRYRGCDAKTGRRS